jgi:hypothetical protein
MPQRASLSNSVWVETQIMDGKGEVVSASSGSNGLSNQLEVAWRKAWYGADIRVTHDIVQGGSIVGYAKSGRQQWIEIINRVRYGHNRKAKAVLSVGNQTGQVVLECTTVEVLDIWTHVWVSTACGLQLTLQIT